MSIIRRDDAFLIFKKWKTERARIFCELASKFGRFRKIGRIFSISKNGFVLRSDGSLPDRADDFVVIVREDVDFKYEEPGDFELVSLENASILLMIDSSRSSEKVILSELIEPPVDESE